MVTYKYKGFLEFWDIIEDSGLLAGNPVDPKERIKRVQEIAMKAYQAGYDNGESAASSWYHEGICQ